MFVNKKIQNSWWVTKIHCWKIDFELYTYIKNYQKGQNLL